MSLRLQILTIAFLTTLVATGWWFLTVDNGNATSKRSAAKYNAATVLVETVKMANNVNSMRVVGTGKAVRSANLHAGVAGEVREITFKPGQTVTKGQVLVQLDDDHQRLEVSLAKLVLAKAIRHLQRLQKLTPSGHTSRARLETAKTDFELAKLSLEQAKVKLRDRSVFAPFRGVIGMTNLSRGDRVMENTLLTTLDDRSNLLVEFQVPEILAAKVNLADQIRAIPRSETNTVILGNIIALGSRIDEKTRSLNVQAQIANKNDQFRPGGSFEVELTFTGKLYPVIKEIAVLWSRDGAYVWRISDEKAEKVFVKMIKRDKGKILVDGPLGPQDMIVVEGVQGLRLGQKVKTIPYSEKKSGNNEKGQGGSK